MKIAYLSISKILILLILVFSPMIMLGSVGENLKNAESETILTEKKKNNIYSTKSNHWLEWLGDGQSTTSIILIIIFLCIIAISTFICPFILLFLAYKNNNEFKKIFSTFLFFVGDALKKLGEAKK